MPAKPFIGTYDHCGMKGQRIRDCRKASDSQKAEWLKKFNERKTAKKSSPRIINPDGAGQFRLIF